MATTGRTAAADDDASAVADACRDADFVHIVSHADGDSIAAAGLLVAALPAETPYQVSTARTRGVADRRIDAVDGERVSIGFAAGDVTLDAESNAVAAFSVATDLGGADPTLAMAGAIAADAVPEGDLLEAATEAGIERRPGVGVPTADLADGLSHSTLFHAPFSGAEGRAGALLADLDLPADLDDPARRRIASAVALVATEPPAPASAVGAMERALRPHVLSDGPFATVEGYADVLESLARSAPGLAVALAIGRGDRTDALDAWRTHAEAVHGAITMAERSRHDGVVVLSIDDATPADARTVARLARDFRSAEPTVLAVGAEEVGLATTDVDAASILSDALGRNAVGGRSDLATGAVDGSIDEAVDGIVGTIREGR